MAMPLKRHARPLANGGNLELRVSNLERRMGDVESKVETVVDNTTEILAVLTGAKGAVSFAKRHMPRVFIFVSGVASAAGVGNPNVWKFIGTFFN